MTISWEGLNIAAALLAPSILFLLLPAHNLPKDFVGAGIALGVLERGGQAGALVTLAFTHFGMVNPWALLMALSLFVYYMLWVLRYYMAGRDYRRLFAPLLGVVPIPLALLPVLTILLAALWAGSALLAAFGLCFAAGHLKSSWNIHQQLMKI